MNIVLPDGSQKELSDGATVADVAASIGAGLAKAALGGKIDGAFADLDTPVHDGATVEIITAKSPDGARHGRGCAAAISRRADRVRPADR